MIDQTGETGLFLFAQTINRHVLGRIDLNSSIHYLSFPGNNYIMLELVPIKATFEENLDYSDYPDYMETLQATLDFYKMVGFNPPWIGYFARLDGVWVGSAGFKGKPVDKKIEIAYGTLPGFRSKGIGTEICHRLVLLALETDPDLIITARTLPESGHSARILEKNGFKNMGMVWDKDDGNVWEWQLEKTV